MINYPDFEQWASNLVNGYENVSEAAVETALEQAFEQGYHLGLNKGWAIEQDKDCKHKFEWKEVDLVCSKCGRSNAEIV